MLMEAMKFFYDKHGDVLDISLGRPKKAVCEELDNDVIIRRHPKTRKVVGFTVLNFEKRFEISKKAATLGVPARLQVVAAKT